MDKKERLRSIWLSADESYIKAVNESNISSLDPELNSPSRSSVPARKSMLKERSKPEDDNCSFIAVPEEFRPLKSKRELPSKGSEKVVDKIFNKNTGTKADFVPFINPCREQALNKQELFDVQVKKSGKIQKISLPLNGPDEYHQTVKSKSKKPARKEASVETHREQTLKPKQEPLDVKVNTSDKIQKKNSLRHGPDNYHQTFRIKSNEPAQKEVGLTTRFNNNGQTNMKTVSSAHAWSHSKSLKQNETLEVVHSLKDEFDEMSLKRNYDASDYHVGNIHSKSELGEPYYPEQSIKWNSNLISEFEKTTHSYQNKKKSTNCARISDDATVYSSVNSRVQKKIRWHGDLCFEGEFQRRNVCYERYSFTEEKVGRDHVQESNGIMREEISKQKRLFFKPDFSIKCLEDSDFDVTCTSESSSVSEGRYKTETEEIRKITWMDRMLESSAGRSQETSDRIDYVKNSDAGGKIWMKSEQMCTGASNRGLYKNKKRVHRKPRSEANIIRHEVKVTHVYTLNSRKSDKKEVQTLVKEISNGSSERVMNSSENEATTSEKNLEVSSTVESKEITKNDRSDLTNGKVSSLEKPSLVISEIRIKLIRYGKDISDLIVGCHRAVDIFMSFYHKWITYRKESIQLITALSESLSKSQKNVTSYQNVFRLLGEGGNALGYVPNFYASITGKVLTFLSGMIGKYLSSSPNVKSVGLDEGKMFQIIELDADSTSSVYSHALLCSSQFKETRELIEEFYQTVLNGCYVPLSSEPEITEFLRDITEFKVTHNIFYARFFKYFQKLRDGNDSVVKQAFCTAFEDFPQAMDIIPHLNWRFDFLDNPDGVLRDTFREISELFSASNSATIKELERAISNCIKVLIREQTLMEIHLKCFKKPITPNRVELTDM